MTWQWVTVIAMILLTLCVFFVCMTFMSALTARKEAAEALRDAARANPMATGILASLLSGKAATRPVEREGPANG